MTNEWAAEVAAYLRERGLRDVEQNDDGRLSGLPLCQACAVDRVDSEADGKVVSGSAPGAVPYAVITPRPGWPLSTAHVTMSLSAYATLLGYPDPSQTPATRDQLLAVASAVVGALANESAGRALPVRDLLHDVDPLAVAAGLAAVTAELLKALTPDSGAAILRALGLLFAGGEL